jgi:hypothetical protein
MTRQPDAASKAHPPESHLTITGLWALALVLVLIVLATNGHADIKQDPQPGKVWVQRISSDTNNGYGYRLEYTVPAPLHKFWLFKTDFDNDFLLSNDELLDHRLIRRIGNDVITENRYAFAPGLRFRWKTTVIREQYRLEFELINAADTRHDFHYGSIQLIPVGNKTMVRQTAYFQFTGASLWVKYPWYGGMKYTLTKIARWEQKAAYGYSPKNLLVKQN